ncbi:Uncharacterized protein BN69_1505 [Methylocystis sp. SC2]|nr:Uncharacterized protein BN69_1505 [Methylocystis sp. SC2]
MPAVPERLPRLTPKKRTKKRRALGLYRAFGLRSQPSWDYRRPGGRRWRASCFYAPSQLLRLSSRRRSMEIYMGIRIAVSYAAAGGALAVAVALAASSGDAYAQANVLKECGSQYQAAKAANELGGQSWQEFLKACRGRLAEQAKPSEEKPAEAKPAEAKPETPPPAAAESKPTPPPATEAKPAEPTPPPAAEATPKPATDPKAAARERQKKCSEEWKAKKAELKKAGSKITWPKYWSECNKRLKAAGE